MYAIASLPPSLLATILVLLSASAVADLPTRLDRTATPPTKGCVADSPCPTVAPPPVCAATGERPLTIRELLAAESSLIGKSVRVAGILRTVNMSCTEMECSPDAACCNTCWSELVLAEGARHIAIAPGIPYACSGDDTGVCCGVVTDKPLVLTGRLTRPGGIVTLVPTSSWRPT